jgi:hypothetical protein
LYGLFMLGQLTCFAGVGAGKKSDDFLGGDW